MTNKNLAYLVELCNIDKTIKNFEPKIKKARESLNIILDEKKVLSDNKDRLTESKSNCSIKIKKNNRHLIDLKNRLDEISKKGNLVKKEKEVQALSLEEEITKEQITFTNEEIHRLETMIEEEDKELISTEEKIEMLQNSISEQEENLQSEMKTIEDDRNKIYKSKENIIGKIEQKVFTFYSKVKNWAGDTAVVPIRRQACYGCYMKLNETISLAFNKENALVTCPYCGRILYKEDDK